MGEVLSQSEIDNLLKALSIMTLPDLLNFQKNIFEHLKLFLNIMGVCCPLTCRHILEDRYRLR